MAITYQKKGTALFMGLFKKGSYKNKNKNRDGNENKDDEKQKNEYKSIAISKSLDKNKEFLEEQFKKSSDVVFYEFETYSRDKALVVYIEEMVKKEILDRDVISNLISESTEMKTELKHLRNIDIRKLLRISNITEMTEFSNVITEILDGSAIIFIDGIDTAFVIPSRGWEKRNVTEPTSESVVKGPREGFVESLNINRVLLRRKIRNPNLIFESLRLGRQTKTIINIVYIDGIANKEVLSELKKRLDKIDTDSILESEYIEEFIDDNPFSPVSTVGNSQKPDIIAAKLLEGRIAILCDGTPHVLTVPQIFAEVMQTGEDYYIRPLIATFLRLLRMISLVVALTLPALYVSLETFHQDMIPSAFLNTMIGASEGIPFPAFFEALVMVLTFEFMKESGTRLPRPIGSAISIVGALVLGDAAVNAGIISADMVIVVAFTAICTFILSPFNETISIYRLIMLMLSGFLGLYGMTIGAFMIIIHLVSLRSFGVPYMSPLAPISFAGLKDYLLRVPIWMIKRRPEVIAKENVIRQSEKVGNKEK